MQDGFAFSPQSEISAISTDDYGTTLTTADYVQRRLGGRSGSSPAMRAIRLPRAPCFEQDMWVVPHGRPPIRPLEYACPPSVWSIVSRSEAERST